MNKEEELVMLLQQVKEFCIYFIGHECRSDPHLKYNKKAYKMLSSIFHSAEKLNIDLNWDRFKKAARETDNEPT